jgi:hypothetical protein
MFVHDKILLSCPVAKFILSHASSDKLWISKLFTGMAFWNLCYLLIHQKVHQSLRNFFVLIRVEIF